MSDREAMKEALRLLTKRESGDLRWQVTDACDILRAALAAPDRRERIATACLAASIVKYGLPTDQMFKDAVECADAFIAELDKEVQP
jgi:hypothetical protein